MRTRWRPLTQAAVAVFIAAVSAWPLAAQGGNALQLAPCASFAPETKVPGIGAFSDVQKTSDGQYGHVLLLWRADSCVIGILMAARGTTPDLPVGELTSTRHDPRTGEFGFTAKLTIGDQATRRGSNVTQPSRDLFTFEGTLGETRVIGGLQHSNQLVPNATPERSTVRLMVSKEYAAALTGAATYGEWRAKWDPILRARGPKWIP